jgi:hypothetical protein
LTAEIIRVAEAFSWKDYYRLAVSRFVPCDGAELDAPILASFAELNARHTGAGTGRFALSHEVKGANGWKWQNATVWRWLPEGRF